MSSISDFFCVLHATISRGTNGRISKAQHTQKMRVYYPETRKVGSRKLKDVVVVHVAPARFSERKRSWVCVSCVQHMQRNEASFFEALPTPAAPSCSTPSSSSVSVSVPSKDAVTTLSLRSSLTLRPLLPKTEGLSVVESTHLRTEECRLFLNTPRDLSLLGQSGSGCGGNFGKWVRGGGARRRRGRNLRVGKE